MSVCEVCLTSAFVDSCYTNNEEMVLNTPLLNYMMPLNIWFIPQVHAWRVFKTPSEELLKLVWHRNHTKYQSLTFAVIFPLSWWSSTWLVLRTPWKKDNPCKYSMPFARSKATDSAPCCATHMLKLRQVSLTFVWTSAEVYKTIELQTTYNLDPNTLTFLDGVLKIIVQTFSKCISG